MKIRLRAGYFVLVGLLIWYGHAQAATHTYRATWDANPPDEQVDRYVVRVFGASGDLATYETEGTEQAFDLDYPVGTTFSVRLKACRAEECSDESDVVDVVVPADPVTPPAGLQIEATVTIRIEGSVTRIEGSESP